MREFSDGDRMFGNELTAIQVDAPNGTFVIDDTEVTEYASDEITIASGTIIIEQTTGFVGFETESLAPLPTGDEIRYDTVTRDGGGNAVVTTGTAEDPSVGAVGAPDRPAGHVFLATVRLDSDGIDTVFDGRVRFPSLLENWTTDGDDGTVPVSQGDGSVAMDSGENSGIDADMVQGQAPDPDFAQAGTNTDTTDSIGGWETVVDGVNDDVAGDPSYAISAVNAEAVRVTFDGDGAAFDQSGDMIVHMASTGTVSRGITLPEDTATITRDFSFGRRAVDQISFEDFGNSDDHFVQKIELWTGNVAEHNHTQQA